MCFVFFTRCKLEIRHRPRSPRKSSEVLTGKAPQSLVKFQALRGTILKSHFDGFAAGCPWLAGGTIPFIRKYSTICP